MRLIACLLIALASAAAAGAQPRPRYGGTLVMETQEASKALEPSERSPLLPLVFDRLTTLDDAGEPRPALAIAWTAVTPRRWEFRLRPGVRFHDGTPLAAGPALAAAIESSLKNVSVSARADTLVFESRQPTPDLPERLALETWVFTRTAEGEAVGTGPFRIARWEPWRRATLAANEQHWAGRPFLDAVEVQMGRGLREQALDLEAGKAALVELAPADSRRARRTWTSEPVELLAVVFREGAAVDPRLREALSLAVDRAAIHNVIFQKQGEAAGGLLPQWLSGWAFLFPVAADLPRARKLAQEAPARAMSLAYDPEDRPARVVAERISLNARDAGIAVTVSTSARADAQVRRVPARSLADFGIPALPENTPQALFGAERKQVEARTLIPLLHLPVVYGAGARVRSPGAQPLTRLGELRLPEVWLAP
jgi:peptide/nickel transport system substrate-binding protein